MDGFWVKTNSIPANHMDMCKYVSKKDIDYESIFWHISLLINEAIKKKVSSK